LIPAARAGGAGPRLEKPDLKKLSLAARFPLILGRPLSARRVAPIARRRFRKQVRVDYNPRLITAPTKFKHFIPKRAAEVCAAPRETRENSFVQRTV
jgi:hypothetical protein